MARVMPGQEPVQELPGLVQVDTGGPALHLVDQRGAPADGQVAGHQDGGAAPTAASTRGDRRAAHTRPNPNSANGALTATAAPTRSPASRPLRKSIR